MKEKNKIYFNFQKSKILDDLEKFGKKIKFVYI
jgi:hypothetical protein